MLDLGLLESVSLSYDWEWMSLVRWVVMHSSFVRVHFEDGQILTMTTDHPIYILGKGWCSFEPDKTFTTLKRCVGQLNINDFCYVAQFNESNCRKVINLTIFYKPQVTYNIAGIIGHQNYFVNGVLVSNEKNLIRRTLIESKGP